MLLLVHFAHVVILPGSNAHLAGDGHGLEPCPLPQGERHPRRQVHHVLTENERGVALFDLGERGRPNRSLA